MRCGIEVWCEAGGAQVWHTRKTQSGLDHVGTMDMFQKMFGSGRDYAIIILLSWFHQDYYDSKKHYTNYTDTTAV